MGFNDFWINNNGKKEHLNNAKHGVRKEQVDKKFHNLFDAYDANGDGTLETEELGGVFKGLTKFAGADKTLDAAENKQVASLFANQAGIEDADFMGFVRSVSKATEDIVDSKETPTADGGREVTTTYKDGSVETISYYPDGEYKFKKLDQKGSSTTHYYTIGNNLDKHYTADEIESRVKKAYDKRVAEIKQHAKQNGGIEGRGGIPIIPNYNDFKKAYLQHFNINQGSDTHNFERHDFELSERGKQDVAVRDFVLSHYVETHKAAQEALESMGILDDVGAAINAGAGELWNSIKNVWNGTDEEYQNFYELSKKFEPNYNKALRESGSLDVMRNNPEMFFSSFETDFKKDMGHQYNLENSVQFQQTAERYQNAQILKQRIDILNKAMLEIKSYQNEQTALTYATTQNEGLNPASHIVNANKLLLQYFNNDQEAVDMILNDTIGNADATVKAILGIKEDTEKLNKAVLDGKTFEQIQNDYKSQYKAIYGTDFVPDEMTEKVMDAKATGGMVKLAAITIVSILITKSPVFAEISGAAAGSAEATGVAANAIRTLVTKYGQTAVQQGIKLAMTSGTLATDVGLTLINQATSERGVNGEELWESTKGSAKYIFFGAYVGAPLAQRVSKALGKIGATSRLFEGGVKTGEGAIQTTSITGDKLLQNFMKGGNTALAKGGAFLTDVAAFTGLEVATEGANLKDALSEQGQMLSKLKVMNHVLEYMLGAKTHTAMSKANLEAAIEKSGVKNWNIKEIKTPQKTQYIVDIDGLPVGKFEDANQLATAMLERVTANYSENARPQTRTQTTKLDGEVKATSEIEAETETARLKTDVKAPEVKSESEVKAEVKAPEVKAEFENGQTLKQVQGDKNLSRQEVQANETQGQRFIPDPNMTVEEQNLAAQKYLKAILEKDERFSGSKITWILNNTTAENAEFFEMICKDERLSINSFSRFLIYTKGKNAEAIKDIYQNICKDDRLNGDSIAGILSYTTAENAEAKKDIYQNICKDEKLSESNIYGILINTTAENAEAIKDIYQDICKDGIFSGSSISDILSNTTAENAEAIKDIYQDICKDERFGGFEVARILSNITAENAEVAKIICNDKNLNHDSIAQILRLTIAKSAEAKIDVYQNICKNEKFGGNNIVQILFNTRAENAEAIKDIYQYICKDKRFNGNGIAEILGSTTAENVEVAKTICKDERLSEWDISGILGRIRPENVEAIKDIYQNICKDERLRGGAIEGILSYTTAENAEAKKDIYQKISKDEKFDGNDIYTILITATAENAEAKKDIYQDICKDGRFNGDDISNILGWTTAENAEVAKMACKDERLSGNDIAEILYYTRAENADFATELINTYKQKEIPVETLPKLIANYNKINPKQVQKLVQIMGRDKVAKLYDNDLVTASQLVALYGKQNINEIPMPEKRDLLRDLVKSNTGMFTVSDELRADFPLIPKNKEEYCSLLPSLVRSLGIDTKELTPEQRITMFNGSMGELSQALAKISDVDFAQMTITQEYTKDKFILDVLDKVKALSSTERQKVYDYFGFELHHNKENSTGFSITGYPVNLNNGKKLAQIKDPRTKAVVKDLRDNVVRFSENNRIKCDNPQVEQFLNEVIEALPELRTTIGKKQHGTQAFDVMQHSLKVMQKVAQDPKFKTLNESDQKIMLLASLMHDITKAEGKVDKTHADYGSFDTYFIAQKFKLTKEEEIKLHTIIKQHEWLEHVNTAKSENELTKRLQSVAYDLHQGNLFDMAEIFTHADLRAVKIDDSFHDTTEGQSRIGFDGTVRSFGESANVYAERIRGYIKELQKSQPLLPQTKVPRASRINEAITQVNPDGSTNIKGVYKDKDGLVIIKFNEVEDWEAIGFPKGSISHGVEIKKGEKGDAELSEDVNTGNIKFFVHGLDYSNQLAKFDAFSLVDSDALLSVSYAERPESKFRFFRPQGVLLDVNSKYIHGGGNTDAGSGCGKDIAGFKNNYIFGGERESDRLYVSDLIKKSTGMTDEQYVKFVEQNKDRPIQEIEPVEIRDKITKAFATINSNTRKGNREYNEMYISNPNEVMGVFAYSMDYNETIGNPVEFLNRSTIGKYEKGYGAVKDVSVNERTEFLRQYALERNLPFIIFGD